MPVKNKMREEGSRVGQGRASDCDADLTVSANSTENLGRDCPLEEPHTGQSGQAPVPTMRSCWPRTAGKSMASSLKLKHPEGVVVGGHL